MPSSYALLDNHPLLLRHLFYPQRSVQAAPPKAFDYAVPVEEGIAVGCRFYEGERGWPWILLFHGNGEIAADYDTIAPFYHTQGLNLVVSDYRGYGISGGRPGFAAMIQDAPLIFQKVAVLLEERGAAGTLWVMGRSMGSVSALELSCRYPDSINGLIVESGFISVARLIRHLGLPAAGIDLNPLESECREKAAQIKIPSLIIHGAADDLVPPEQAEDLYRFLGSKQKKLVLIPRANHNSVILTDPAIYFSEIAEFIKLTKPGG